jgi:hypothetical protein
MDEALRIGPFIVLLVKEKTRETTSNILVYQSITSTHFALQCDTNKIDCVRLVAVRKTFTVSHKRLPRMSSKGNTSDDDSSHGELRTRTVNNNGSQGSVTESEADKNYDVQQQNNVPPPHPPSLYVQLPPQSVRARRLYLSKEWKLQKERNEIQRKKKKEEARLAQEDSDYVDDEELEGEELDILEDVKNEREYLEPLDNTLMAMWKTDEGKVSMSKYNYDTERTITKESVEKVLGSKAKQLKEDDLLKVIKWFELLKKNARNFMRDRVVEEIMRNAGADHLGLGWTRLKDLQDAWDNPEGLEETAKTLHHILTSGFFAKRKGLGALKWQEELEKEFMEKNDLVYPLDERQLKRAGCLAKQASRSRTDVIKTINYKGKNSHGKIFTTRQKNGSRRSKTGEAAEVMVREGEKNPNGGGIGKGGKKKKKKIMKVANINEASNLVLFNLSCFVSNKYPSHI